MPRTASTTRSKAIKFEPLAVLEKARNTGRPRKPSGTTYTPKLTLRRDEYRTEVMDGLRKITGLKNPDMTYAPERRSGEPRVIFMHGVELFGVPREEFAAPGDISSVEKLDALIAGFRSGRVRWVRLSRAEIMRRKRKHGIEGIPDRVLAMRADATLLRPLRPLETSPRLRKGSVNKTSELVPEEVLAAEAAFEARMAEELAAEAQAAREQAVLEEDIEDADQWSAV